MADVTNHSFKADKKIHYIELVEKSEKSSVITAKIMGKSWGAGALRILDFEISTGQRFTNNLHVLVQVSVDFNPLYGLSVNLPNKVIKAFIEALFKESAASSDNFPKRINTIVITKMGIRK